MTSIIKIKIQCIKIVSFYLGATIIKQSTNAILKLVLNFIVAIFQISNIRDSLYILRQKTNQVYISTIRCFQNVNPWTLFYYLGFFLSRISFFFKKIPLLWIIHTLHISIKYATFFLKTINDVVSFEWNLDKFTRERVVFSVFKYAKMTFKYSMLVFLKNKCNLFFCFLGFNEIWEYHIVLFSE